MLRKILVALDHSPLSHAVFQQAVQLAQATQAQLQLLHVLSAEDPHSPTMPVIPVPEYYPALSSTTLELYQEEWKAFEAQSLAQLEQYRTEALAAGVTAELLQRQGPPGRTICDVAQETHADLIMLGRRGHAGLSELLLGSVSNFVVHHAPCSVLVVNSSSLSEPSTVPDQTVELSA